MTNLFTWLETGPMVASWLTLLVAFALLAKCAGLFVESAVGIAERFRVPKLVIGIVLVSVATTTPELSVSAMAALRGNPEMALGNAVGSVICNCGIALALCGLLSSAPVPVLPAVFKSAAFFLVITMVVMMVFVLRDGMLGRIEGLGLMLILAGYLGFLVREYRRGRLFGLDPIEAETSVAVHSWPMLGLLFAAGLAGVLLSGKFVVVASVRIAQGFGVPESVIAMTLVALGTSIPEVSTSVIAAIKGQGALSVGNIMGANIMNICWVAGASAVLNPLSLARREILFMFPAMLVMVVLTLGVLRSRSELSRMEGAALFLVYLVYLGSSLVVFR